MEFNSKGLSSYLLEHCFKPITRGPLFEGIRSGDIDKALGAISSFLKKRKIYTIPVVNAVNVGVDGFAVLCYTDDNKACAFVWERGDTNNLYSVLFSNDFDQLYVNMNNDQPVTWDMEIRLKGASVVRSLQLVADVMTGKLSMDRKKIYQSIQDAQIWESADMTDEEFDQICEATDGIDALDRKVKNLYHRIRDWEKKGKDTRDLQTQYDELKAQLMDARVSVRSNVSMTAVPDPTIQKMQDRFEEEERATPEERFEDMEAYISNVIRGINNAALICGAPGVGKSFRIMQMIDKAGLELGKDYQLIKGKCTPLVLYTTMHDFQNKGQLIICDDADDIVKDDTSINLIKAATDSSKKRVVSYGTSNAPIAPEEKLGQFTDFEQDGKGIWRYPKNFIYDGGMIIITNMNAGMVDTAIRSRAMICDLSFTVEEVLGLIRDLSPHICPESLTPEAKDKALKYLTDLAESGAPMDLSIRVFKTVSEIYMSDAPERAIQRRIREQMKLQYARGGKKY